MGRHGEPEHGPRGPAVLDVATHVNVETVERSTQQQQHQHHNHNSKGPADDHFRIFNLSLVPNSKFVFINRNLIFQFTFRHSAFLCTISAPPTNVTRPLPRHDDDFFCLISSLRRSAFVRLMKLSLFHLNDFFHAHHLYSGKPEAADSFAGNRSPNLRSENIFCRFVSMRRVNQTTIRSNYRKCIIIDVVVVVDGDGKALQWSDSV